MHVAAAVGVHALCVSLSAFAFALVCSGRVEAFCGSAAGGSGEAQASGSGMELRARAVVAGGAVVRERRGWWRASEPKSARMRAPRRACIAPTGVASWPLESGDSVEVAENVEEQAPALLDVDVGLERVRSTDVSDVSCVSDESASERSLRPSASPCRLECFTLEVRSLAELEDACAVELLFALMEEPLRARSRARASRAFRIV